MTRFIGLAFYYVVKFIKDEYPNEYQKFYPKLRKETQEALDRSIMSNEWYELDLVQNVLDEFYNHSSLDALNACARYSSHHQMKGIFGLLSKFVSVPMMLSQSQRLWDSVFSDGKIMVEQKDGSFSIKVSEFHLTQAHRLWLTEYFQEIIQILTKEEYIGSSYEKEGNYHLFYKKKNI